MKSEPFSTALASVEDDATTRARQYVVRCLEEVLVAHAVDRPLVDVLRQLRFACRNVAVLEGVEDASFAHVASRASVWESQARRERRLSWLRTKMCTLSRSWTTLCGDTRARRPPHETMTASDPR